MNSVQTPDFKEKPEPTLAEQYIQSLSPKEKKAYLIARDHLGTSFHLEKSVGFLAWKSKTQSSSL
jgi:hypothetical protein